MLNTTRVPRGGVPRGIQSGLATPLKRLQHQPGLFRGRGFHDKRPRVKWQLGGQESARRFLGSRVQIGLHSSTESIFFFTLLSLCVSLSLSLSSDSMLLEKSLSFTKFLSFFLRLFHYGLDLSLKGNLLEKKERKKEKYRAATHSEYTKDSNPLQVSICISIVVERVVNLCQQIFNK